MTNLNSFNLMSWFTLMMIITTIMTNSAHPMLMMILVLLFNSILCINMSMWKTSYLYSLMFFLIMISGLMIIFLYFSSLVSNEMWVNINLSIPMLLITMMIYIQWKSSHHSISLTINPSLFNLNINQFLFTSSKNFLSQPLELMYSSPSSNMTLMCMLYLLISMIAIIKICSPKIKSLRKLMN